MARIQLLLVLLPLFDYNPEPDQLDFAFANDHQSKKKDPVAMSRDQRLSRATDQTATP